MDILQVCKFNRDQLQKLHTRKISLSFIECKMPILFLIYSTLYTFTGITTIHIIYTRTHDMLSAMAFV